MRWIIIALLFITPLAGCKNRKKKPIWFPSQPTWLKVDSLTVEGQVDDNFADPVQMRVNGNSIPVTNGTFSATLNTGTTGEFVFEAEDDAGNITTRLIRIE